MAGAGKDQGHNLAQAHMPGIQALRKQRQEKIVGQSPGGLHEGRKKGGREERKEEGRGEEGRKRGEGQIVALGPNIH